MKITTDMYDAAHRAMHVASTQGANNDTLLHEVLSAALADVPDPATVETTLDYELGPTQAAVDAMALVDQVISPDAPDDDALSLLLRAYWAITRAQALADNLRNAGDTDE